jgi:hypothetical protein
MRADWTNRVSLFDGELGRCGSATSINALPLACNGQLCSLALLCYLLSQIVTRVSMRSFLTRTLLLFVYIAYVSVAGHADSLTFGDTKFDFDAPAPQLTTEQRALFQRYKDAVNRRDEAALMSIQDGSMNACAIVARQIILKDMKSNIPDGAKVVFFATSKDFDREMGFGDLAYLSIQPTAVMGINSKRAMILRPVRQRGESWTLIPYCLTEKGKVRLEQNGHSHL